MSSWKERTELLLGAEGVARLDSSRVCIAGAGGVGAAAAEMLVRAGVGHIILIDSDSFSESNINRQLPALHSTVGRKKVDVLKERLTDINPDLDIVTVDEYLNEESIPSIFSFLPEKPLDFMVDAIDTLSPKIALAQYCIRLGIPLVSSMGSGAKSDATQVRIVDIGKTYECPLARMMRKRLHKLGIDRGFLAVFSPELPDKRGMVIEETRNKKSQVGTISYLPAVFGCVCAQAVIRHIVGID